jgi:1,4-dihydroxy-2-naphthoyl-CoA hydrolase
MAFQYLRRVYLGDTDAAGVVYFATGMAICHEAYEESLVVSKIYLNQMLGEKKIALPIIRAEIDFWHPLFCGDRLQVNLTTNLINSNTFTVNYQIFDVANLERIVIKAQTKHVCINPNLRTRLDLPPVMLNWLKNFSLLADR